MKISEEFDLVKKCWPVVNDYYHYCDENHLAYSLFRFIEYLLGNDMIKEDELIRKAEQLRKFGE